MNFRRVLRLLAQNYQLAFLGVGVWLIWRGLSAWSGPLASVVLGMGCVALALVPHLRRKDRSE